MKRKKRNRIIIAWVLLLALLPISLVKATHFHETGVTSSHHTELPGQPSHGNDGNTCPICDFCLSPFVEAPAVHLVFFPQHATPLFAQPCPEPVSVAMSHPTLRAPPSVVLS